MSDSLAAFGGAVGVAFVALVPLINPAGVAPIFLSMTAGASDHVRDVLAWRVARNAFVVLVTAMIAGSWVLILFGLSPSEIRIAGGLLVIATAWHLIMGEHTPDATLVELSSAPHIDSLSVHGFYPLTFPVTIGPGSLVVATTLGAGMRPESASNAAAMLGGIVGCVFVAATVYLCYRFAPRVARRLGAAGTAVVLRLSAFILLSVGVKILCDGILQRFTAGSA
jgi:multiple antibiotic resistance protein